MCNYREQLRSVCEQISSLLAARTSIVDIYLETQDPLAQRVLAPLDALIKSRDECAAALEEAAELDDPIRTPQVGRGARRV